MKYRQNGLLKTIGDFLPGKNCRIIPELTGNNCFDTPPNL